MTDAPHCKARSKGTRMRQAFRQIVLCALGLLIFCILCRLTVFRSFTAHIPLYGVQASALSEKDLVLIQEEEGFLYTGELRVEKGFLYIPITPVHAGETWLEIRSTEGNYIAGTLLSVSPMMTVYDRSSGNYTGDSAVLLSITLLWLLIALIVGWHFLQSRGSSFYDHSSVYFAGFFLFSSGNFLMMLYITLAHLYSEEYNMFSAYQMVAGVSRQFMLLTMPLLLIFALAMAISNIALLRHEKPRLQNGLGLLLSLLLIAGEAVGWFLFFRNFAGSEWELRIQSTMENIYATAFVYFECMLLGSVICGIRAVRHRPAPDKDFILILGCWFRPDGTLPPLLRGRVDRALSFWFMQKERTGREAILIPSGGQGRDECMPEAEAMRRYLLSRGIPDRLIRPETQSVSTLQNMSFSRKIIEEQNPAGQVLFVTSNYHIFRSGILAAQAGLPAEGIGSRTVWWFWPNAFLRECAGMLHRRWKQEIAFLFLLIAFFSMLTMLLS